MSKPAVKIEVRARAVAFAPDGKSLAVAAEDGSIVPYDPSTGKPLAERKE